MGALDRNFLVDDTEIARVAEATIGEFGGKAARMAAERLNEMIDHRNDAARDIWARIVQEILQIERERGFGPATANRVSAFAR